MILPAKYGMTNFPGMYGAISGFHWEISARDFSCDGIGSVLFAVNAVNAVNPKMQ